MGGGVGAFWSISSKESGCCRLKYRSCSPVWLLNLLMFLLSAILSSILAVSIMRNMLGWCYFCCFLTAVIVPQCSWRKAMFSCGKERKGEKKLSQTVKAGLRKELCGLVDAGFCAKIVPVNGCSHGMFCTHTQGPTGASPGSFPTEDCWSCWLGCTCSPAAVAVPAWLFLLHYHQTSLNNLAKSCKVAHNCTRADPVQSSVLLLCLLMGSRQEANLCTEAIEMQAHDCL